MNVLMFDASDSDEFAEVAERTFRSIPKIYIILYLTIICYTTKFVF